MAWKDQE